MLPRRLKFCKHYIETLNSAEAARRAGYSQKTADRIGSRLLRKVEVKEYISKHIEEGLDSKLSGLRNRIVNKLEQEGFENGNLKALEILSKYSGVLRENSTTIGLDDNIELHSVTTIKRKE